MKANWHNQMTKTLDVIGHCNHFNISEIGNAEDTLKPKQ